MYFLYKVCQIGVLIVTPSVSHEKSTRLIYLNTQVNHFVEELSKNEDYL